MIKHITLAVLLGATTMTYADNINQNIQLTSQQQTVQITLPANATTGYQWYVQNYDRNLLSTQSYRYGAPTSTALGAGSNATFVFNIDPRFYDAPQITTLTFIYQQPWNPGKNTTSATVTISSTASSNDTMDWQKYPSSSSTPTTGPSTSNAGSNNNWLSLPPSANSTANS